MNKFGLILGILLVVIFFMIIVASKTFQPKEVGEGCIRSFHEFAYERREKVPYSPVELEPLPPPWQMEASIPEQDTAYYGFPNSGIELIRATEKEQEIWLYKSTFVEDSPRNDFLIYYSESKHWQTVLAEIKGTNFFVRYLFMSRDGTIWGTLGREHAQMQSLPDTAPVLSKLNEQSGQFEPVLGGVNIPITESSRFYLRHDVGAVVLDNDDIFWIFINDDGIYRYDPHTETTERRVDLPAELPAGFLIKEATLSSEDNHIYFRATDSPSDLIFEFLPETGETILLESSYEYFPPITGLSVDQMNRLWLGSVGFIGSDKQWHLIHPDPRDYYKNRGGNLFYTLLPSLTLASSDGVLWYYVYLDTSGSSVEGTAWYDPKTGEGCLFTNIPGVVMEDEMRQLWMAADGKLYRYALE